jgi:hypothetical protein
MYPGPPQVTPFSGRQFVCDYLTNTGKNPKAVSGSIIADAQSSAAPENMDQNITIHLPGHQDGFLAIRL